MKKLNHTKGLTVSVNSGKDQKTFIDLRLSFWDCIWLAFKRYRTITITFLHPYTHHQNTVVSHQYSDQPLRISLEHKMMSFYDRGAEDGKYSREPNPKLRSSMRYCQGYVDNFTSKLKVEDIFIC